MRLAEQKRFAHLRFMGELRTCRSLSYITDYCSINDIYSNEGFPIEYYTWRTSTNAKMQQIMMPAMILFMGFAAPSGLVLYWITGNLFTMTQTIVLRKIMEREELQLQSLENTARDERCFC